jgi:hypothetical protein
MRLHVTVLVLGNLLVAEVLALGAIMREHTATWISIYVLVAIACELGFIAWGLG